jgi:hypothetical protein
MIVRETATGRCYVVPPGRFGPFREDASHVVAEMRAQGRFREAKEHIRKMRAIPEFQTFEAYILYYADAYEYCARLKSKYVVPETNVIT